MLRTLEIAVGRGKPLVIIAFGDSAAEMLDLIGLEAGPELFIARRAHPAFADRLFAEPNPFGLANQYLEAKGLAPIAW
jgi:uracil DNA glycosylase